MIRYQEIDNINNSRIHVCIKGGCQKEKEKHSNTENWWSPRKLRSSFPLGDTLQDASWRIQNDRKHEGKELPQQILDTYVDLPPKKHTDKCKEQPSYNSNRKTSHLKKFWFHRHELPHRMLGEPRIARECNTGKPNNSI